MAVIESSTTVALAKQANCTFTKPTGLAVGDLLYAVILNSIDALTGTPTNIATPAGWTNDLNAIYDAGATDPNKFQVFTKIADSSDVAASNFVFPIPGTTSVYSGGILFRISDAASLGNITAQEGTNDTTAGPFAGSLDIGSANNILIMVILGGVNPGTGATTGFTVSGTNPTWTKQLDINVQDTDADHALVVATAPLAVGREITSYQATWPSSTSRSLGALLYVSTPVDATGTNALHEASPVLFTNAGVESGTTGTNTLMESSPTFFDQSGRATTPTVWTNEDKPSTTWTNESL